MELNVIKKVHRLFENSEFITVDDYDLKLGRPVYNTTVLEPKFGNLV